MKSLGLCVLLVAGCGAQSGDGALLTFTPPPGLPTIGKIDIILASADSAMIEQVMNQRTMARKPGTELVTYYRQAASGGAVDVTIDGPINPGQPFSIRLAPNRGEYPDEQYIPFVLIYAATGELAAIATVHTLDDATPLPIKVPQGSRAEYMFDAQVVATADPIAAIGAGQDRVIDCPSANVTWRSGLAWRPSGPGAASQIRLLLPDLGADANAKDALSRMLDLDCDDHVAVPDPTLGDCDDTLPRYHRGADELCDGEDTNCDDQLLWTAPCSDGTVTCPNASTQQGIKLCDDAPQNFGFGACQNDPECLCQGAGGTTCKKCLFEHTPGQNNQVIACTPGVAKLNLPTCTSCNVIVVDASPGWDITIAADSTVPFGKIVTGAHLAVIVKAVWTKNGGQSVGTAAQLMGQFQLAVGGQLMSVALQMSGDSTALTCPAASMTCQP
ncbi:MAG: hypothetical protein JWO36_1419 [Myxococcales bacterium]|nr:hypothetical protein [Myxococcales bacterium]